LSDGGFHLLGFFLSDGGHRVTNKDDPAWADRARLKISGNINPMDLYLLLFGQAKYIIEENGAGLIG
jgi:hypothetical protein